MRSDFTVAILVALLVASCIVSPGSANGGGATFQFTARQGYYNNLTLYYLLTDVSDQPLAQVQNVNYTPRLANALSNTYLPQVYQVTNFTQGVIFSADWSTIISRNNYMPLWVLYNVRWYTGKTPALLRSVADVNTARAAGKVSVTKTTIVVGASIVVNSAGVCIRQGSKVQQGLSVIVTVPVYGLFVGGTTYRMLMLDFSNRAEAQAYGGNYSANMAQFNALRLRGLTPASWQNVYSLWNVPSPGQLPVGLQVPSPFGWQNANANYSPLMNEYSVRTLTYPPPLYTSYSAITTAGLPTSVTGNFIFQPVLAP
jgi:hypothetical protein